MTNNRLIIPVSILLILLILSVIIASARKDMRSSLSDQKDTISIIGVGDIMPGSNFPSAYYLPPNDGKNILKPLYEILHDADITFGNLEGAVLDTGGIVKKCQDPSKCYAFRIPEHYMQYLKDAGFDVLNLANNHSGDFGEAGRSNTLKVLDQYGLKYTGLLSCPSLLYEKDGLTYGFCGFSPFTGSVDILNTDTAEMIVSYLDSVADIVVVSMHAGAEGSNYQHVTRQTEIFYDEDRGNVYEFAHQMVDAGADIVFGHGPHVTRAIELYNDRFIAYSLGNFCTYARFNLKGPNGYAPVIKVYVDRDGKFLYAQIYCISQPSEGGPIVDINKRAIYDLINLTTSDFPETPLIIETSGLISIRK